MYNCAVIGLGNIGFKFSLDAKRKGTWSHVEAYKKVYRKYKLTKLVGAVETNPNNVRIFKSQNSNVPVYRSVEELFNNQRVDLISICVPTEKHFSIVSKLLDYDVKAIFCEKPLSHNPKDSEMMVELARRRGIVLAVNYTRRWQASYNKAAEMIRQNKIGNIEVINSIYSGQIYNIGSHLFDTIRMIVEVDPIMVSGVRNGDDGNPSVSGWLKFKNNVFVSFLATGRREYLIFEIDVIGEKGRLRIVDNGSRIERFIFKESRRYSGYRELVPQKVEMPPENDRFIDAILDIIQVLEGRQKKLKCSGEDALWVDRIIEKAITSANKNGVLEDI